MFLSLIKGNANLLKRASIIKGKNWQQRGMTNQKADAIVQKLKDKGLRVTPQRYAVYANLLSRTDHPTAEQILKELNQAFPVSSQATVYSSLQTLKESGLVREVLLEHGVSHYDAKVEPHHHFVCEQCSRIEDIPWDTFGSLDFNKLRSGLQAKNYELIVRGFCDRCK